MFEKEILDQIEKNHQLDLPKNMIDQEVSIMTQSLKAEEKEKHISVGGEGLRRKKTNREKRQYFVLPGAPTPTASAFAGCLNSLWHFGRKPPTRV